MITKAEKLGVLQAERERVEHGLFAAEVDVRVSDASPEDAGRMQGAKQALNSVRARLAVCDEIQQEIEAEPDPEPEAPAEEVLPE